MSPTKPTILIIHGGYFLPSAWTLFISTLKTAGLDALCPRLPTCGDIRPPTATLADDVKVVQDVATKLVQAGKQVIVLAHSYGGIPASEAIIPALYSLNGAGPGVIHLIYLTCWLIPKSQSVQAVLGKYGFLSHVDVGMNDDGTAVAKNAPDAFYNDVLPALALKSSRRTMSLTISWWWAQTSRVCRGWMWRALMWFARRMKPYSCIYNGVW